MLSFPDLVDSCLFPDVVDSQFSEQVDRLPDIVDIIPGFVDIFLKRLTPAQAKPYTMKTLRGCQAAGGAKPFLFHTEKQTKEGC